MGIKFDAFQSNHEGALLDRIHAARLDGTEAGAWAAEGSSYAPY